MKNPLTLISALLLVVALTLEPSPLAQLTVCECNSRVLIYSNGLFEANITHTLSINTSVTGDFQPAIYIPVLYTGWYVPGTLQYVVEYQQYPLAHSNTTECSFNLTSLQPENSYYSYIAILNSTSGVVKGYVHEELRSGEKWVNATTYYELWLIDSTASFKVLTGVIYTNDYANLLNYNITLYRLLYSARGIESFNYTLRLLNRSWISEYCVMNFNLTLQQLEQLLELEYPQIRIFLGIPPELSSAKMLSQLNSAVLNYTVIAGKTTTSMKLNVTGLTLPVSGDYYALKIPRTSIELPVASTKRVTVYSVNWTIIRRNSEFEVAIRIKGRGFGADLNERVKSILDNLKQLSERYGCFNVVVKDYMLLVNSVEASSICVDKNFAVEKVEVALPRKAVFPWLTYSLIAVIATLGVTLIALILLNRRWRRLTRRQRSLQGSSG